MAEARWKAPFPGRDGRLKADHDANFYPRSTAP
jgi:hypothetical protein